MANAAERKDMEEVRAFYNQIREREPDLGSRALAAVKAIVMFIQQNKMDTIAEFSDRFNICVEELNSSEGKYSSIRACCHLFRRQISLTDTQLDDFERCQRNMIMRAQQWVNKMTAAKDTIAKLAEPFIHGNSCVLTHSYSRVVMAVLKEAANKGKLCSVYVTMSEPDKSGLRTAKELREIGLKVRVILDAAVASVMAQVSQVLVGAEYIVESGGILNKIGTYNIALTAKKFNIPFYVVAESLKFLEYYPIDQRTLSPEIKYKLEEKEINYDDDSVQPLIDYTPPEYINRVISDIGVGPPGAILDEMLNVYG